MGELKRFVYLLQTLREPGEHYVGLTSNVVARLEAHNGGRSPYTARHRPWAPLVVIEFAYQDRAARFERYLKTGSGREFARRHFR